MPFRTPATQPNRIAARFAQLRAEGRGALIHITEAYDPDAETSMALLDGMPGAGADLIEIGVPFTDPMADGPIIQQAGQRALKAGGSLVGALAMVRDFRRHDRATPIVLMGYFNPILSYGCERFATDAASSGVDGLIVVDLPPEEADELTCHTAKERLELIRLVAPTTDDARLPKVLAGSGGFVYFVSITGITGSASADAAQVSAAVARIKRHTRLPVCVGFGIRTPDAARGIAQAADGAVVGSALIDALRARGWRLATAESCTGGGVAHAVTAVAGSSDAFERGFVTYSNEAKVEMLGVPAATIERDGAVSESVAVAMAEGALRASRADVAVSITGVAGPGGGTADKPVGLVWLGCARTGAATVAERHVFPGDRAAIRRAAVAAARRGDAASTRGRARATRVMQKRGGRDARCMAVLSLGVDCIQSGSLRRRLIAASDLTISGRRPSAAMMRRSS